MKYVKNIAMKAMTVLALVMVMASTSNAQKFAVVDVNEILESLQEYQDAQIELDKLAKQWRQDIQQEYDVIKGMYNRYQAEQVLMSEEARQQEEQAIMDKEKMVRDMQKAKFGPEGELFKRRQDLVRPVQEKVYKAIEDYADDRGYDIIFDRSGSAGIIFTNPDYNKTSEILKRLK